MNINQRITTTSQLTFDLSPELSENKDVHYLMNGDFTSHGNNEYNYFIQNANSNKFCIDFGAEILGIIKLNDDKFAVFINNEIIEFDSKNCVKRTIVTSDCLKFSSTVKGVYKYNQDGRVIYFIDEKNGLRYLNIDDSYPKINKNPCDSCEENKCTELDCDALLVWKKIKYPKIKYRKGEGNIPSGKYQVAIAITDGNVRISDYFIYPEVLTISPNEKSSLNIEFECFNQWSKSYEVVLITHREDRGTVAQRIGTYNSNKLFHSINQIDAVNYAPIDTKILLAKKAYYQSVEHIAYNGTTTEGNLLLGGVKERDVLNYTQQAFNIKSNWVEVIVPSKDAYKIPSHLRDEVYSFSIAWLYKDGQISNEEHIPSLIALNPLWDTIVQNDDTWIDADCGNSNRKFWEIYNTAQTMNCSIVTETMTIKTCEYIIETDAPINIQFQHVENNIIKTSIVRVSGTQHIIAIEDTLAQTGFYSDTNFNISKQQNTCQDITVNISKEVCGNVVFSDNCEYKVGKKGTFAYWESGENYPNKKEYGNYKCKPIRHFKFPDNKISNHHTVINEIEYVNCLGVEFSNIERPKDCNDKYIEDVVGYIIYVSDRANNKSISHKGMLSNMFEEKLSDCTTSYYNNYPFNDLNPDVFLSETLTHGDIRNSFKPVTKYSQDKFMYISPDVDYIRNTSGEELIVCSEENGYVEGSYHSTNEFPQVKFLSDRFYNALSTSYIALILLQLTGNLSFLGSGSNGGAGTTSFSVIFESMYSFFKSLGQYHNYAMLYFSKAGYSFNNFVNIKEGNIRRKIEYSNYVLPIKQLQDNDKINNYQREQGLYVKLNKSIIDPDYKEYSRVRAKDTKCKDFNTQIIFNPATNSYQRATCSSYYVAFKMYKPNQYGNIHSTNTLSKKYIDTLSGNVFNSGVVLSGDVYITKHTKLRKFPFFKTMPPDGYNDTGFDQKLMFNIWKPRFWFNFKNKNLILNTLKHIPGINVLIDFIDKSDFNFEYGNGIEKANCGDVVECIKPDSGDDVSINAFINGRFFTTNGSIYTHVLGVQQYWCESEFISEYREKNEIAESNVEVDEQSLIKYSRVEKPELSLYNLQYLWQGVQDNNTIENNKCCNTTSKNKVVFSQKNDIESNGDNWLSFLPLNYHQFTNTYGKFIGIVNINESSMAFVFEDATFISNTNNGILTEKGIIYQGEGSIFSRQMTKCAGSQDIDSFVVTPFGLYWANRKEKEFYYFNGQYQAITDGVRSWAYEYMTNPIHGGYDEYTKNIYWSSDKWTISYKPQAKTWVSYHSFIPEKYIELSNNFLTYKDRSLWKHNEKYSYTNYYGKQEKFIIGITLNNKFQQEKLYSLELRADFIKELSYASKIYTEDFFDKMIAYAKTSSTGLREIVSNNTENINQEFEPLYFTKIDENIYRVNNFTNYLEQQPVCSFDNMTYSFHNDLKSHEGLLYGQTIKLHMETDKNLKILLMLILSINNTNVK